MDEEPDLQLRRGEGTGKRNSVADAWRNCDEEDSHRDVYLVIYRQVPLRGNETFGCDIDNDSRGRVDRLGVVEREWERESCGRVFLQVDIKNRPVANAGVLDRIENLHMH